MGYFFCYFLKGILFVFLLFIICFDDLIVLLITKSLLSVNIERRLFVWIRVCSM